MAIIDDQYVDPFLFQIEPVSLEEVRRGGVMTVNTLAPDQKIRVSLGDELQVRLIRVFPDNREVTLIEYDYDLGTATDQMPNEAEFMRLVEIDAMYLCSMQMERKLAMMPANTARNVCGNYMTWISSN